MLLLRVSRSVSRETFLTLDVIMPKKAKGGVRMFTKKYDVVVVGGGHAGCEAAAAARLGFRGARDHAKPSVLCPATRQSEGW